MFFSVFIWFYTILYLRDWAALCFTGLQNFTFQVFGHEVWFFGSELPRFATWPTKKTHESTQSTDENPSRLTALDEFGIFGDSYLRQVAPAALQPELAQQPNRQRSVANHEIGDGKPQHFHNILILYCIYIYYMTYNDIYIFPCFRSWTSSYKPIQWVSFWVCQDFARGNSAFLCLD